MTYQPPIYDLQLHETFKLNSSEEIMRVPGGWIYKFYGNNYQITTQFVPYDNEFQPYDNSKYNDEVPF